MKVTVTKNLNVRVGAPRLNAPCYQYLAPGSELEIDGKTYDGDPYHGNDQWYRDEANNYYWSGGVEFTPTTTHTHLDESWWIADFGVSRFWNADCTGSGVGVAVLDTGLSLPHPDLSVRISQTADLSNSSSGLTDRTGHGTHMAGIIKSSHNGLGIQGIAPDVSLYFGKVTGDLGDDPDLLAQGIEWATQRKVDIISISKAFSFGSRMLMDAIKRAVDNGILIVCAAGNRIDNDHTEIDFPARYALPDFNLPLLTVGGVDQTLDPLEDTINPASTMIFAPGKSIKSTFKDQQYKSLSGSSPATAYVAGIAALRLQLARKKNSKIKAINLVDDILSQSSSRSFGRIINPNQLFKNA